MSLSSDLVGRVLASRTYCITTRQALAFAAVFDETGDVTFCDNRPDGIRVLPQFCACLEWLLNQEIRKTNVLQLHADEHRRALHLDQDSQFHGFLQPGRPITLSAKLDAVRQSSAGVVTRIRYAAACADTGRPVFSTTSTTLYRDVAMSGDDFWFNDDTDRRFVEESDYDRSCIIDVPKGLPHIYSECSRIWNPIHTERAAAMEANLPDVIVHGSAIWGLIGSKLVRMFDGANISNLSRLSCRFVGYVFPGTQIVVRYRFDGLASRRIRFCAVDLSDHVVVDGGLVEIEANRP